METTAASHVNDIDNINYQAGMFYIDDFLGQIAPYIKQRSQYARRFLVSKNDEEKELCKQLINDCNKHIRQYLKAEYLNTEK